MNIREWIRGMRGAPAAGTASTVSTGRQAGGTGRKLALAAVLACTALASGAASAQWHHPRVGISFGFGYPYPGYYYPPPYYYPPAVITVPAQPQVYVEQPQAQAAPAPQASADWFYCNDSRAYYPYVKDCPGGWQRVPAQPAR